jgi:hypothetical protein
MDWGRNRVTLSKNVGPNGGGTFTFTVTAPTTPGTYNFQWQMIQEGGAFFGDMSTNKPFTVAGGGGGGGGTNNAAFMSQNVPSAMTVGQAAAVSLVFNNTGTTTWSPGTYMLTSLNPSGNSTWGLNQVQLASAVAPGGNATFNFNITAPTVPGSYNCQWGLMQSGVGTFGTASTNVAVNVTSGGGGGTNNAAFVSQSVPSALNTGQSSTVSVTMSNNGTKTWAAGSYSLQSQNPASNTTWGLNRVNLASAVAPGGSATFTFTITAPTTAGTYNFQWKMAQDGVGAFGALTTNVAISVTQASGGQPLTLTTTTLPGAARGVSYSATLVATGGTPPYTWSISSGALPPGLSLNANTGVISGTPTAGGSFTFVVRVADQGSQSATRSFKMSLR